MIAPARMMIVPGNTGSTVPIRPKAKRTIVKNHQKSSMRGNRKPRMNTDETPIFDLEQPLCLPLNDLCQSVAKIFRKLFDRLHVDLILNLPQFYPEPED